VCVRERERERERKQTAHISEGNLLTKLHALLARLAAAADAAGAEPGAGEGLTPEERAELRAAERYAGLSLSLITVSLSLSPLSLRAAEWPWTCGLSGSTGPPPLALIPHPSGHH
jgi:hypothetical protein